MKIQDIRRNWMTLEMRESREKKKKKTWAKFKERLREPLKRDHLTRDLHQEKEKQLKAL